MKKEPIECRIAFFIGFHMVGAVYWLLTDDFPDCDIVLFPWFYLAKKAVSGEICTSNMKTGVRYSNPDSNNQ